MTRQPGCLPVRIPDAAAVGLVQMSDANGNVSWQPLTAPDLPANLVTTLTPSGDTTGAADLAAINTLLAAGTPVTLAAGTYYTSGSLTVTTGSMITGAGDAATIIHQTSTTADTIITTAATVTSGGIKSVILKGFRLQGPGSGTGNGINLAQTSANVNTYADISDVRVRGFGGDGVKIDNPIVSRLSRVISDTNTGNAFNINGGVSGTVGTSVTLEACYGNNCGLAGFQLSSLHYSTLVSCASDACGAGYILTSCQNVTLTSCGSESHTNKGGAYTGQHYEVSGGKDFVLQNCYTNANAAIAFWVTGSATGVKLAGPKESSPSGATASIQVDTGCTVTVESPDVVTAVSYSAGATVNALPAVSPQPPDLGYLAWPFDPVTISSGTGIALGAGGTAAAGSLTLVKVPLHGQAFVTGSADIYLTAVGSTLTSGQCFIFLYDSGGHLLAATADQATAWTTGGNVGLLAATWATGPSGSALTANPMVSGQFCWVGFAYNGTTGPALARASNLTAAVANGRTSAATTRYGSVLSGITTNTPGNFNPANIITKAATIWTALY